MKFEVVSAAGMPPELQENWRRTQRSRPFLAGPCFHPRLFSSVAENFPGIKIAILSNDAGGRAYLPFLLREGERIARSVPACDYQGIVAEMDVQWDMREVLRGLNLVAWEFDNLVFLPTTRPPDLLRLGRSSRVVLGGDLNAYLADRKIAGKSGRHLKTLRRRLQRDLGPLRFVAQSRDAAVLDALVRWKADRFSGFAEWARRTMELIHTLPGEEFNSVLSALFAGDSLVAAHFGLRCDGILHYWFPSFNPEFSRYSPGGVLMEDLIAELPRMGCHTLDLGPGGEGYKDYFANSGIDVHSGEYTLPSLHSHAKRMRRSLRNFIASTPLLRKVAAPVVNFWRKSVEIQKHEK